MRICRRRRIHIRSSPSRSSRRPRGAIPTLNVPSGEVPSSIATAFPSPTHPAVSALPRGPGSSIHKTCEIWISPGGEVEAPDRWSSRKRRRARPRAGRASKRREREPRGETRRQPKRQGVLREVVQVLSDGPQRLPGTEKHSNQGWFWSSRRCDANNA